MSVGRVIPVLNSSSSSLKYVPFEIGVASGTMTRGEIEDLDSTPHLGARVSKGAEVTAKHWSRGAPEDFAEVPNVLLTFIDENRSEDSLIAVGHPGVQCGGRHIAPEWLMAESLAALEAPMPVDPLYLRHTLMPTRAGLAAWPTLSRVDLRNIVADDQATIARHTEACPTGAGR